MRNFNKLVLFLKIKILIVFFKKNKLLKDTSIVPLQVNCAKIESCKFFAKHHGISLIENIATIMILATSLAAASYLLWSMINSVEENKKRVTATYLAQECSELTRNIRDTAWRQNLPWNCGFFTKTTPNLEITENSYFQINNKKNINSTNLSISSNADVQKVCQQEFGVLLNNKTETDLFKVDYQLKLEYGEFNYDTGVIAPFFRRLVISKANTNDDSKTFQNNRLKATCEVGWISRQGQQKIEISQILTNWKQ